MSAKTSIEWTGSSWTPFRARHRETGKLGWACTKPSAGCAHCYSEARNKWIGTGEAFTPAGLARVELFLDPKMLLVPLGWQAPRKVFVCSMTDLFLEQHSEADIDRVFAVMAAAPRHTFQVLTKRAERMRAYVTALGTPAGYERLESAAREFGHTFRYEGLPLVSWPLPNVWCGVSVEDQATADARIPLLLQTPAAVRFVSYEPALGPVDFTSIELPDEYRLSITVPAHINAMTDHDDEHFHNQHSKLDWVIVGGESGPGARPFDVAWALAAVAQCKVAGVACFVKQLGAYPIDLARIAAEPKRPGDTIVGEATPDQLDRLGYLCEMGMIRLKDRKGGDMSEWPEDLRVREFPA